MRKNLRGLVAAKTFSSVEAAVQFAVKVEGWHTAEDEPAPPRRFVQRKKVAAVREEQPKQQEVAAAPAAVKDPRACYRCGKVGHLSRFCKATVVAAGKVQAGGPKSGGAGQPRGVLRCFACNETGHVRQWCPRKEYIFCTKCRQPGHVAACCGQPAAKVGAVAAPADSPAPQSRD